MGKGYNNYMCKKPFHPGSKANIKRAWMAEQKTENEKKKQEELKVQYDKEQELYNNRALLSTESKDKLELNFMYQAPPGAKRERQKEDDEPEFKFEWQRKYNAPREDYAKGNADIKDQPFGIPVRNVRCIKCHKWGHINTDKECPLFSQASTSSMPTTSMDPMELMKQMREDGYGLKENVLGHHLNPAAANQQLIPSDESDPEMEFLKSLSASEKKKLLRKLKKLSKKQEKASHCKKKKSKKSGKSKSKDKSTDHKQKKSKKFKESESSDESGSESSSEESTEEKQRKKKHSKKQVPSKKTKQLDSSESSDSELYESNKSKSIMKISQTEKEIWKKHAKTNVPYSQKAHSLLSDSGSESKKSKYKISKYSKSKKSKSFIKGKNNSSESDSEFEKIERRNVIHLKKGKSSESMIRTAKNTLDCDQERNIKMSSEYSIDKKSRSCDKINDDHLQNRSKENVIETVRKVRTCHKERSSSESQDEKRSYRLNLSKKATENKIKHKNDVFGEKQSSKDIKSEASKSNDNYKDYAKLSKHDRKNEKRTKEYKINENVENLQHKDFDKSDDVSLHQEINLKQRTDKEHTESKWKKKDDNNFKYEQKTKNKNVETIKTGSKKNTDDSIEEQLSKRKRNENEPSELKRKKIELESVEQNMIFNEKPSVPDFKKKKDGSVSDEEQKLHGTNEEQKQFDSIKKNDESKMGHELNSQKKRNSENKQLQSKDEEHDNNSKNLTKKQKCNFSLHPDGFSHLCPQARIEANYLQADEEYQGKQHDDFRLSNREKRSPSVKQKYNN